MFALGLTRRDVRNLERLSDEDVLRRLPSGRRHLRFNDRRDVAEYMRTWAGLLEEQLNAQQRPQEVVAGY